MWLLKVFFGGVFVGFVLAVLISAVQAIFGYDVTFWASFRIVFWVCVIIDVIGGIYSLGEKLWSKWDY